MAEPTSDAEPSSTTAGPAPDGGAGDGDGHNRGGGWRQKSNRFLAAVAAAALIVVLLGGMAIGYAIEKGRVKDSKTTAVKKKKTPVTVKKKATVVRPRVSGTVTDVSGNKITITPKKGAKRVVTLQAKTVVVKASGGAASDIATSSKVLFSGTSFTKATSIIVLPKSSLLGSSVVKAEADSMSVKAGAKSVTIATKGASVDKTAAAKSSDITKGSKVMISLVRVKGGTLLAVEVILLPDNSPFA